MKTKYRQTSAGLSNTVSDQHSFAGDPMDVTRETSQAKPSQAWLLFLPKQSSSRDLVVHPGSYSSSSKECGFMAFASHFFSYVFWWLFVILFLYRFGYIVKACYRFFTQNSSN